MLGIDNRQKLPNSKPEVTMPRGRKVTLDSYIRELPISAYKKLENFLDPSDMWEKFMENIPQLFDDPNSDYRYTAQDGLNIRTKSQQKGRSPTVLLLEDWDTQNPKIRHLIEVLKESELYAAADFLSVNILKGSPVPRTGQSTFSSQCTEPPPGERSFNTGSYESNRKPVNGKPEEHNERSPYAKCDPDDEQNTKLMRTPGFSISESLDSGKDLKSLTLLDSPPPAQEKVKKCEATKITVKKCVATENDETDQMKKIFKKIDIGGIEEGNCPRITYSILKEMTDNFNDKDFFDGGRLLGSGGFGAVYLGVRSGHSVAIKRLKDTTDEQTKLFETELKVLSKFHHENLVSLLGYSCGPKFCLVYTYMVNGSLEDRLKCKNKTPPLSVEKRVHIAKGTAQGIHYLNSNNIVHRDIKSANVLLDEYFVPKVGDFATARTGPKDMTSVFTMVVTGTAAYLAPEAYQHDVSVKLDSYSYGVILLELLTALPVVDTNREERDLKSHIVEQCEGADDIHTFLDNSAGTWTKQLVEEVYNIAMKCLVDRKKKRVTITDILPEIQRLPSVNSDSVTSTSC